MLLSEFAKRVITEGDLTIIDAAGRRHRVGDGRGRSATIRLHDRSLHHRLAINPFLHLGEAYMAGTLTIEKGSLYDFLDICAANVGRVGAHLPTRVLGTVDRLLRRLHQYNPAHRAQANAAHHYDLSDTLYDLFLDADRQYSCAYFTHAHNDLEQAQHDKKRHLAAKLLLKPGRARARHRLRLGRPRAVPRRGGCGGGGRHHAVRGAAEGQPRARQAGGTRPSRPLRAVRLPGAARHVRPDRLGRHVRACRRRAISPSSSRRSGIC